MWQVETSPFRGDRLRRRREQLGLSQEEVAAEVGWARSTSVSFLETGDRDEVPLARLKVLANAIQVRPGWLLGEGSDDEYEEGGAKSPPSPPKPVQPTITPYQSVPGLNELVGLYLAMKPAARVDALRVMRALSGNPQYQDATASAEPQQLRPRKRRGQSGPRP